MKSTQYANFTLWAILTLLLVLLIFYEAPTYANIIYRQ